MRSGGLDVSSISVEDDPEGCRGVRASKPLAALVAALDASRATGCPAETELLHEMRSQSLPEPVLQFEVVLEDGRRYRVDFVWPQLGKGVEVDGLDAHAGAEALERDLQRQNAVMNAGIQLRRYTAREVRRDPKSVVAEIARFLL